MRGHDDGLRIYGGMGPSCVDAVAVREAAAHADRAIAGLENARFHLARAVREIEGLAFAQGATLTSIQQPEPAGGATVCSPGPDLRYRHVAEDFEGVGRALASDAIDCAAVRDRLLRAAGLYEDSESFVEQVTGFAFRTLAFNVGFIASAYRILDVVASDVAEGSRSDDDPGDREPDEEASGPDADSELLQVLTFSLGPWWNEIAGGLAHGIVAGRPVLANGDFSTGGAAQVLSRILAKTLPNTTARVREIEVDALTPAGEHAPTGTILASFDGIEGLYGRKMDGTPIDVPDGVIAVERVEHADGTTSWTVTIPGTQDFLSESNPFDGQSDVEAMSHDAVQVTDSVAAVTAALAAAGVQPDEPVVLIGHSLGGITALALTGSAAFRERYTVGGVVTAGTPAASFRTPPGVPVLHVENEQDVVSALDGQPGAQNPHSVDRVTVVRDLMCSPDPRDRAAAFSITGSHSMPTFHRSLEASLASGDVQVTAVVERIESIMTGTSAQTQYYQAERVEVPPPPAPEPSPTPGPPPVEPDQGRVAEHPLAPLLPRMTTVPPISGASSG